MFGQSSCQCFGPRWPESRSLRSLSLQVRTITCGKFSISDRVRTRRTASCVQRVHLSGSTSLGGVQRALAPKSGSPYVCLCLSVFVYLSISPSLSILPSLSASVSPSLSCLLAPSHMPDLCGNATVNSAQSRDSIVSRTHLLQLSSWPRNACCPQTRFTSKATGNLYCEVRRTTTPTNVCLATARCQGATLNY